MPWNREYIGQALQGFGAGVAGRGAEFTQQLDEKRKEALLKDAYSVQQMLKGQDYEGAKTLLTHRVQQIQRLGGDPTDTMGVLAKVLSGDNEGALRDVTTAVDFGTRMGYLKSPNYGIDYQTSAPKKVIGYTASGKPVNGNVSVGFDPATQAWKSEFIPDVGEVDPNDPVVRTENVDVTGLTGPQRIDMQTEASSYLKGRETEEQAARTATEKRITRNTEFIDEAMLVAEQIPTVRRAIALLNEVKTGNVQGALQWAKQKFGVQNPNEAELSNLLSTNVLQQLRPTFGAQFTKAEGDWLKTIEPNLGKSDEGNIRILQQLEKRLVRRLNQGMKYAQNEDTADPDAYDYINSFVTGANDITNPGPAATDQPAATGGQTVDPGQFNWEALPGYKDMSPADQEELRRLMTAKMQGGG